MNLDVFTKSSCLTIDLYAIVKELFKGCAVENTIISRLGEVNGEFVFRGGFGGGGGLGGLDDAV
jgi:hypothetical protein